VPFEVIFNPFNVRDGRLTDTERLKVPPSLFSWRFQIFSTYSSVAQLLEAGLIFGDWVSFAERGVLRRRTPPLPARKLRQVLVFTHSSQ